MIDKHELVIADLKLSLKSTIPGYSARHCGGVIHGITTETLHDVISMLKLQESKNVNVTISQSDGWKEGNCPNCGMKLDGFYNELFCGSCGQAVKW